MKAGTMIAMAILVVVLPAEAFGEMGCRHV